LPPDGKLDYTGWAAAMEQTSIRCALWVTGDLPVVMRDLAGRNDIARDAIAFWLGAEHLSRRGA